MATPKDKSMITQRVIVDGREALLVLPQVWDEALGDWVVTDGNNRLPVEATIHADDLGVNGLPTKDDILAGKVDTLESTMQDVITEISSYKVIFPESQTIDGSVSVDNIPSDYPDTSAQTELKEIKGKLTGKTEVTNLPDNQKVSDADVKAELEAIKQTQSEILTRLDSPIDTQVTGSIDGYALPTESVGRKVEHIEVLERAIRLPALSSGENNRYSSVTINVPVEAKKILVKCVVYGLTGTFGNNEGYRFDIRNMILSGSYSEIVFTMENKTTTGNGSGATFEMGEGVYPYDSVSGSYQGKPTTPLGQIKLLTWLKGEVNQEAGEGLDYSVDAYIYY